MSLETSAESGTMHHGRTGAPYSEIPTHDMSSLYHGQGDPRYHPDARQWANSILITTGLWRGLKEPAGVLESATSDPGGVYTGRYICGNSLGDTFKTCTLTIWIYTSVHS